MQSAMLRALTKASRKKWHMLFMIKAAMNLLRKINFSRDWFFRLLFPTPLNHFNCHQYALLALLGHLEVVIHWGPQLPSTSYVNIQFQGEKIVNKTFGITMSLSRATELITCVWGDIWIVAEFVFHLHLHLHLCLSFLFVSFQASLTPHFLHCSLLRVYVAFVAVPDQLLL